MTPAARLQAAIRSPRDGRPVAVMPYLTSGFPMMAGFADLVSSLSQVADAIEIGVPFSDPMADGMTIQASSQAALAQGVTLPWILAELGKATVHCPLVLMSYLNPLLAYGLERLVVDAAAVGVCGFIVPDLPLDESESLRALAGAAGLGVVQLVTPVTPEARLAQLTAASGGFVYAVTVTGVTGAGYDEAALLAYLDRVRAVSPVPVCAGFGIGNAAQVQALAGRAHGAIVGSALIRALAAGEDGVAFVRGLLPASR